MGRISDYQAAVATEGRIGLVWRHDLLDPDGQLVATTDVDSAGSGVFHWGAEVEPIDFNSDRVNPRSATLIVPATDPRIIPTGPNSWLHPEARNRVQIQAGIVTAAGTVWETQATLTVAEASGTADGGVATVKVELADTVNEARTNFDSHFGFDEGETVEAVVARILAQVEPGALDLAVTGFDTPAGTIPAGANRYRYLNWLLEGCGHELVSTRFGLITSRAILSSDGAADELHWVYGAEATGGIPVDNVRRDWAARVPRGWSVEAGSAQTTSTTREVLVFDTDPRSEGYFSGLVPSVFESSSYPYAKSQRQSVVAGYGQLRRHGVGPMIVQFDSIANPMMREGDLIDLTYSPLGVSGLFRVMSFANPLHNEAKLRVTVRGVFDPAINFEAPLELQPGCNLFLEDRFDREDSNLEDSTDPIGSPPGSPDWDEIGYSWGLVNGEAIQRFNGGWSLAYATSPMCWTDHQVTVNIARVPSGKRIGPMCRSTAQFDGYAALLDHNGVVTLETWQNGVSRQRLGSHDTGQTAENRSVTVRALGTRISVLVGTDEVIVVDDSSRTGQFVGMLGLGGYQSTAPAIDLFRADQAV